MKSSTPLIWLCTATAAALCLTAALLGIRSDSEPAVIPLLGAAQEKMYTVSPQSFAPPTPSSPVKLPEPPEEKPGVPPQEEEETAPEQTAEAPQFFPVDAAYFDDALFIGDSHIEGLYEYGKLNNAAYFYQPGLTVWSILNHSVHTRAFGEATLEELLGRQSFGKLYVMLGINELGTGDAESWAEQYRTVLEMMKEKQPNATIFLMAIFHTTAEKSAATFYTNETINARNAALAALCDGEKVIFLDCNPAFDDETGALRSNYSGDGVHVTGSHYVEWRDYLFRFGR